MLDSLVFEVEIICKRIGVTQKMVEEEKRKSRKKFVNQQKYVLWNLGIIADVLYMQKNGIELAIVLHHGKPIPIDIGNMNEHEITEAIISAVL